MTSRGALRRGLSWLRRGLAVLGALLLVSSVAVALLIGTSGGRAWLLSRGLNAANDALPGVLSIARLELAGPFGCRLSGLTLDDPSGQRVLRLDRVEVQLQPLELGSGRIVLRRLLLDGGLVDLSELGAQRRGLRAALVDAAAPPSESGAPPYVRIDELRARGLVLRAPELPPLGTLEARELALDASFELDRDPRLRVTALSLQAFRAGRLLAEVGPSSAVLAGPGERSALRLAARAGGLRLELEAEGVLPPAPGVRSQPLAARLALRGLHASELAEWLQDPAGARAFEGELGLDASLAGSVDQLSAQGQLQTAAGAVAFDLRAQQLRRFELTLASEQLRLARVRADLPDPPLALRLTLAADVSDPAAVPLRLQLQSARWDALPLPDLEARAVWQGDRLTALHATARRGESSLELDGEVARSGTLDLKGRLDLRRPELAALAGGAAPALRPAGSASAQLHLRRSAGGVLDVAGSIAGRGLRAASFALVRGDLAFTLRGPPEALGGNVQARLVELRTGTFPLEFADVRLEFETAADLQQLELQGRAHGSFQQRLMRLVIAPTRLSRSGAIRTAGIQLHAGAQALRVSGAWGGERNELVLSADDLDLTQLAELVGVQPSPAGQASLRARLSGSLELPRAELDLKASGLQRGAAPPLDATLRAELDVRKGVLTLDSELRRSGATGAAPLAGVHARAELVAGPDWWKNLEGAPGQLELETHQLDLGLIEAWLERPLPVSGQASLKLRLAGSWLEPELGAELSANVTPGPSRHSLSVEQTLDYRAGQLRAQLELRDARGPWLRSNAQLESAARGALPELLAGAPRWLDESRWQLALELARRRLSELPLDVPELGADFELDAELEVVHLPGAEPSAEARLRLASASSRMALAGCEAQELELELTAKLAAGQLQTLLVGKHAGGELLHATSGLDLGLAEALRGRALSIGTLSSELRAQGLRLQSLPFLCRRVQGELDARVDLVDPLGLRPSLAAQLALRRVTLGARPELDVELRARADQDDAELRVNVRAPQGQSQLWAAFPLSWSRGRLAVAADATLEAKATLDQLPIAPLLDPRGALSQVSGRVSGELQLNGPLRKPVPKGHLELLDAGFTATALAQPLRKVQGRFVFEGGRVQISGFEAQDAQGEVRIDGQAEIRGASEFDADLNVVAKDFPLRQRGRIVATTSAHAKVSARVSALRTELHLVLVDADTWLEKVQARTGLDLRAHPDFVLEGATAATNEADPAGAGSAPEADAPEHLTLLELDASDHFWVKREDFAIQLSTRLSAQIQRSETNVQGRVEIQRGYLDLMGRVFEISRGSYLTFTGSGVADPALAIEATHERRNSGKTVKVKITGRGSRPELSFWVNEAEVSAGEALAALLGGRAGAGTEEQAKGDAKAFVSGLTAGLLATSARRELGAAAPIVMIEPGDQTGRGRIRAGFELDSLLPEVLRRTVTGVYVEGIVAQEGNQGQASSTQAGVLVELYFPYQLFWTGQWGPGTTWSSDWGWQAR